MPEPEGKSNRAPFAPEIRRAPLGALIIYEISESELEILERGSPSSIFLNFAIFLLSVAISFTLTLTTTTMKSEMLYVTFLVVSINCFIVGILFVILWWRNYQSMSKLVDVIRRRLPPEGVSETLSSKG